MDRYDYLGRDRLGFDQRELDLEREDALDRLLDHCPAAELPGVSATPVGCPDGD